MAKIGYLVCDRCGKRFDYRGEKMAAVLMAKNLTEFRETKIVNHGLSGFDYLEYKYDLCNECTKKLDDFFKGVDCE